MVSYYTIGTISALCLFFDISVLAEENLSGRFIVTVIRDGARALIQAF
jgi:hypothetical protein